MNPVSVVADLPAALIVLPGGRAGAAGPEGVRRVGPSEARSLLEAEPVLTAHAALTFSRLGLAAPARSPRLFDILELVAFVRPAAFCAPSAAGVALALGLEAPSAPEDQAATLRAAAERLLAEIGATPRPSREEALAQAETLGRAGWPWAAPVVSALRGGGVVGRAWRSDGLDAWTRLSEWEEAAPVGEAGSAPISPEVSRRRLADLVSRSGFHEAREAQAEFAGEAAHVFQPRQRENEPAMMLAEAGTGVGKTLAYLAPAAVAAELNGGPVWISTFTRALQRQIDREAEAVRAAPGRRPLQVVVRKGRENYACLLNFQDSVKQGGDAVGLMLAARWLLATKDGDMAGGDFPAWLPTLFDVPRWLQASPANLADRRGECLHGGCAHYRRCFVEKAVRASQGADLVIANHALTLSLAAREHGRPERPRPGGASAWRPRRIVFDEGHHLFDAADSAFSVALSGAEAAQMRRWIRGPETHGRRGRGLEARLAELVAGREAGGLILAEAAQAAAALPGEGWSGRIAPGAGLATPSGPVERFLASAMDQLRARATPSEAGQTCAIRPAAPSLRDDAAAAALAIGSLEAPLAQLAALLEDRLDEAADSLPAVDRARIEGALAGVEFRSRSVLPTWRAMLTAIGAGEDGDPDFVEWLETSLFQGRVVDIACRRHWVDPTAPLHAAVIAPAHGVLVTSATLADPADPDPFALARMRTGAARLAQAPKTLRLASPFDYRAQARVLVVNDVDRRAPRQVAAAMRALFLAAGGGALGLFTAIDRLKAAHRLIAGPLADRGLALFAQHVDPVDVGALIDMFRAEEDSCLLGVDAVRDGIDVPGRALRLLVFERVPWPRPDLLHQARKARFGGSAYADAQARARIAQAFGRLIRGETDRGVFVMLDAAAPSRLFTGLPDGADVTRLSLVEAIEVTKSHLAR